MSETEQSSGSFVPSCPHSTSSGPRKWMFRLIAVVLVPLLLLALAEVGLRLAGYGYETSFFLKQKRDGKTVLVENPHFGFRFFPPGVARSPTPVVIPAQKEPGAIRIFVLGESAALGDPKPAFGMGRYLEVLLNSRYPEKKFEVVCVAMTAINSHVVLPIARECARHDGDLWIVYMGNNEMIGPFGGATEGKEVPSVAFVRASLWARKTRLGQFVDSAARKIREEEPQSWRGLSQYGDRQVAADDPVRARVDENFQRNLRDILRAGQSAGVKTIVSDVCGNLRDWSPHASLHKTTLSPDQVEQWKLHFIAGIAAATSNRLAEAAFSFERASAIDPLFAETHFRTAVCQAALSNWPSARKEFQAALDCDALPVRTTSARNEIIRKTAEEFTNARFVRLSEAFARNSGDGIPGRELFVDHVHFTFAGAYAAARGLGDEVEKVLELKSGGSWLSQNDCEAELGLSPWNRYLATENILTRLNDAVYTNQTSNLKTRRDLREQLNELRKIAKADGGSDAMFKKVLAKKPTDFFVQQNCAEYLELKGDAAGAIEKWQNIRRLLPHHPIAYYQCGRLDLKLGKFGEAEKDLLEALEIRPDFNEAQVELGQALRKQGKKAEAVAALKKAVMQNPSNPAAHFYFADALAFAGQKEEAYFELQKTIALRPTHWEARYFLGVEQAMKGDVAAAEEQFREVTRLRPDFPLGYLNLGVAQARQKKFNDAETSLTRTLELDPGNASARKQLETVQSYLAAVKASPKLP